MAVPPKIGGAIFKVLVIGIVFILAHTVAHHFPGRSVGYAHPELRRRGDEGRSTASTLRFVSNSHFRVIYPQTLDAEQAERVLNILETGRTEILHRVSVAGIRTRFPKLEIVFNETTGDFVGRTDFLNVCSDRSNLAMGRITDLQGRRSDLPLS